MNPITQLEIVSCLGIIALCLCMVIRPLTTLLAKFIAHEL